MKKLLFAAVLSLAGVGLTSGQASAGIFHCLFGRCHKCSDCETTLCVKAYNAFSPTCFGTLWCNGCAPISGPGFGYANHGPLVDGACYGPDCLGGLPYAAAPMMPAVPGVPQSAIAAQAPTGPVFQAPVPSPLPTNVNTRSQAWPYPAPQANPYGAPQANPYGWYQQPPFNYGGYPYPMPYAPVGYYPNYGR